ncbi:hypothetical protein GCM10025876_26480 [Demequina litorisediminis]|uniref:AAA+ ATPase domain-containing protein n=1 Tax=Demequina litorisediminis TaxID=1849022 RepID=A0ABQ6IEY3_9MICO|nr:hypothetical protein GCM10025876_26480 [Demequina litorisediminis]
MTTLEFQGVSKRYHVRGAGDMLALDDVSFTLTSGQTIALVGQSGSGKSTIAKILTQAERATSGDVLLDGEPIPRRGSGLRRYRQRVRMVFQDPFASLNPYHTIRHHLARPLALDHVVPKDQIEDEVRSLLTRVRLDPDATIDRRPHEALRRSASARGYRPRACLAPRVADRGRTGVHARRVDPPGRPEPPGGPPARVEPRRPLHHPRPRHRAPLF